MNPNNISAQKKGGLRTYRGRPFDVHRALILREVEVDPFPQFLPRLEMRHVLLGHLHLLARLRIASGARRPVVQAEAAEPADLDALALREALGHRVEDHLHRQFGILGNQLRKLRREAVDQLRFGHVSGIPRSTVGLVVELRLQKRAEIRRPGARSRVLGAHPLHRLGFVGVVLRLDREVDAAILAVDVDDHRAHVVAFLQPRADVLDTVARDFRRAQIAFDVATERDHGALRVEALDAARHDAALVVRRDEVAERIALDLPAAERDAYALYIDREHDLLDFLALLVITNDDFAGLRPRQIGKMHEAGDAAGKPDEHAEVGDRLDLAADAIAL